MSGGKAEVPLDATMMSEDDQQQSMQSYMVRVLAENGAVTNPTKLIARSLDEARPLLDIVQFLHDDSEDYAPPTSDDEEDEDDQSTDDDMDLDEEDYASDESSIYIEEDDDDEEDDAEDNDDGELSEGARGELAWRLDQTESFSDWTIDVSIEGRRGGGRGGGKKEYHVHRLRLATGSRKCDYFAALFSSTQFKESEDRVSRIKLPKDAADAFPAFLDFLYVPLYNGEDVVNADNMRALRYLANYFLTPKLNEAVNDFIETDMRKDMAKLEAHLSEFGSDGSEEARAILGAGCAICAEKINKIPTDSALLFGMSPAFFLQVFTLLRAKGDLKESLDAVQAHSCKVAVAYIRKHKDSLDEAYFSALTRLLHLPDDDDAAGPIALDLLEIMKEMGWTNGAMLESFVAALSRYLELTDADVSPTRLSEVVSKIPTKATAMVLSDAINGKKNESITGDDVDITFVFQSDHFRSEDDEIFLTLNSTDTIRSVKYFLCRSLGAPDIMGNIVLRRTVEWTALQDHKTLSDYGIDEGATRLRVFRY